MKRLHLDGIQANSSIKTTGQEPGLLAPGGSGITVTRSQSTQELQLSPKSLWKQYKEVSFQPALFDQRQHENRMQLFGKVTANDVPWKLSLLSMPNQTSE